MSFAESCIRKKVIFMNNLSKLETPLEIWIPVNITHFQFSLKESAKISKLNLFFLSALAEHHATVEEIEDATQLSVHVIRQELQSMYQQKLLKLNEDDTYQLTELSESLLRYQNLLSSINAQSTAFLFNYVTGEIDLLKKFQWYEKTNGITAKKIVSLFEIDCIEPLEIKELLLEAYPFLKEEEELLLNDFLENMVITAVHEKNDVFLKKYITHLPARAEEESEQSLKIISYLYQLEYQPYDAYLEENASVTQKIQEINLFDSALLTEKAKSLLNLVESYQQAKKNTIYVYVNPVTMQAEEGIFEGSCNPKKAVFDLSQYSLETPYEEIASEFLKEHSVTPFELQKVNDTKVSYSTAIPVEYIISEEEFS